MEQAARWDVTTTGNELDPREIAAAVAPLLGGSWEYHADRSHESMGRICGASGMEIRLHRLSYSTRLEVTGGYPSDGNRHMTASCWGVYPWNSYHKIRVGAGRPVEAIAKEIRRRFLPRYKDLFVACCRKAVRNDKERAESWAVADRIAEILGVKIRGWSPQDCPTVCTEYTGQEGISGKFESGRRGVEIKLSSVPPDVAERIAKIVAEAGLQAQERPIPYG
jgi:hypothetical protein